MTVLCEVSRPDSAENSSHILETTITITSMSHDISAIEIPHELVICLDHVGIAVPDLDAAIEFYRTAFGWVNHHQETNEEQGVVEAMIGPKNLNTTDGMIQLLAPLNDESTIAKFLDKKGPGLQQMCLRTSDIEALSEYLKAQGIRLLYPAAKSGTGGAKINFVHPKDAGGVLLELTQPV